MQEFKELCSYYTEERWNNWINKIKETDLDDSDVFVNMQDDVVLSCLKIISKFDKKVISTQEALDNLNHIKEIVLKKIEPINQDIDLMLESMQYSFIGVFASCECYINSKFKNKKKLSQFIKKAVESENNGNMAEALDNIAQLGANVISGAKLPLDAIDSVPEGIVAEWLDGIESINAALIGCDSYKNED